MKKKVFILLSAVIALLLLATFALADSPIKLLVNGQNVESDVPVQIIENRTMVPVRALANALGADVSWDEAQRVVSVENQAGNGFGLFAEALSSVMPVESLPENCEQVEFTLSTSPGNAGREFKKVTLREEASQWVIVNVEEVTVEEDSSVNPEEGRETKVQQVPHQIVAYADLPADVQAIVDSSKHTSTAQVLKGEGDTQYALISLGARNTGGYAVEISSVEEVDGEILVIYQENRPAPDKMVIQVITYPWQIIQVDTSLPISIRKIV